MVGGESFAVDASLIKADANRQKGIESEKWLPPKATGQAIDEYLAVLHDAAFGAATEGHAQVHLAGRPGGALDRRPWRAATSSTSQQPPRTSASWRS
jgi:hypothetical protein